MGLCRHSPPNKKAPPKETHRFLELGAASDFSGLWCGAAWGGGEGRKLRRPFPKRPLEGCCTRFGASGPEKNIQKRRFPPLGPRLLLVRGAGTPLLCLLLWGIQCGSFFGAPFDAGVGAGTPRRGAGTLLPPFCFERGGAFVCVCAAFQQHARLPGENAGFLGISPPALAPPTARTPCKPLLQRGAA